MRMNYQETLAYLYAQLPMFQRVGAAAITKSLANTEALVAALGRLARSSTPRAALRRLGRRGVTGDDR